MHRAPPHETVWLGRDNAVLWQLEEDGRPLGPARAQAITRVVVDLGAIDADSDADPAAVSWEGDVVALRLGHLAGLDAYAGRRLTARLIVYSADEPAGVVWTDQATITVRGDRT
jgi:hypothetical protein